MVGTLKGGLLAATCAYEVSGELISTGFTDGVPSVTNHYRFRAAFSNEHWFFEMRYFALPVAEWFGSDGSNQLVLSFFQPEGSPGRWHGRILPGRYPENLGLSGDAVRLLSITLAPKSLYDSQPNKSMLPPWMDPGTPPDYYRISCQRMPGGPELPLSMTYEGPNYLRKSIGPHIESSFYEPNTNRPLVVMARYEVTEMTNIAGVCLPLRFEWRRYSYGALWDGLEESKALVALTVGTIHAISLEPRVDWLPKLPAGQAVRVCDHRFQGSPVGVGELDYTVTNGCWPTTNDPVVRLALAEAVAAARYKAGLQRKRPWAWAVLVLLALPPLLAYWGQRRRQDAHQTSAMRGERKT